MRPIRRTSAASFQRAKTRSAVLGSGYKTNSAEISILIGNFLLTYLGAIYREFQGDLAMAIVLGELAHHNISRCYCGNGTNRHVDPARVRDPEIWENLTPCNAYSLSAATGIPRETVRRKIACLLAKGWLTRNSKGEVFMTRTMVNHFHSDFDIRLLNEFMGVADRVHSLLGERVQA